MNNKFWRDVFDQIASLVLIFRKETDNYELMFVNKAIQTFLGYKPELYVMESEQPGALRDELVANCRTALGGESKIPFTAMNGQKVFLSASISEFYSESIKEHLLVMTVQWASNAMEASLPSSSEQMETQLMKTVRDRIESSLEQGASLVFVGAQGSGKRFYQDRVFSDLVKTDGHIVKMDYSSRRLEMFCDGVQSDIDQLTTLRKPKPVTIFIYEMQQMSKADQKKLLDWCTQADRNLRFIIGSKISPDQMVSEGSLEAEFYYHMNLTSILLPGLNHRRSEIQGYSEGMIRKICDASGVPYPEISAKEWTRLFHHDYSTNFDELNSIILRSVIKVERGSFQFEINDQEAKPSGKRKSVSTGSESELRIDIDSSQGFDEHMRIYLSQILLRTGGKIYGKDGAAALLGMKPTTLQSKLEKYNVRV